MKDIARTLGELVGSNMAKQAGIGDKALYGGALGLGLGGLAGGTYGYLTGHKKKDILDNALIGAGIGGVGGAGAGALYGHYNPDNDDLKEQLIRKMDDADEYLQDREAILEDGMRQKTDDALKLYDQGKAEFERQANVYRDQLDTLQKRMTKAMSDLEIANQHADTYRGESHEMATRNQQLRDQVDMYKFEIKKLQDQMMQRFGPTVDQKIEQAWDDGNEAAANYWEAWKEKYVPYIQTGAGAAGGAAGGMLFNSLKNKSRKIRGLKPKRRGLRRAGKGAAIGALLAQLLG